MVGKRDLLLVKTHRLRCSWMPLGLMYVAAGAEKKGAKVGIIDLSLEEDHVKVLKSVLEGVQPRIVGIGGMYEEFNEAKEVAAIIKVTTPTAKVIVGGPMATSLPQECLQNKNMDVVILREGESTIQDLLLYINGETELSEIKGIVFKSGGEIIFSEPRPIEDIDGIPIPSWHLIEPERYIESKDNWFGVAHLRVMNMAASRGCPYHCIYCDKNVLGQKWRGRNPKNIVDEMILLKDRYGAEAIMFVDDIFDVNRKWVLDLIDEMRSRDINMYWGCNSRANHADYEMYKKMHEAGCSYVGLGVEFGSDSMLKKARKQLTVEQAHRAIGLAKKAGLRAIGYHMIGMLDETQEEINETIKFAINSKLDSGGISVVAPITGTELYDIAVKAGKIDPDKPWWEATRANALINLSKNVSSKHLVYLISKTYWMFFWSRPARKWPRWMCKIMQLSFYVFYPFVGERFGDFTFWLDKIRRKLHLSLP